MHLKIPKAGDGGETTGREKEEFKRREAILELASSEEMYLKDLNALYVLLVEPMERCGIPTQLTRSFS